MVDFAEAIEDCRLMDPGFDGADFTWAKNGLFEQLDRVLVNEAWTRVFEATWVTNLPRIASDHGLVLARCKMPNIAIGGKAFRFQNMWIRYEGFLAIVQNAWEEPMGATSILNIQIKHARVKKALKKWNKEVFANIHANVANKEEAIVVAQSNFEVLPTPVNRTVINKHIVEYILLLRMEEDFWRQKAALRWLAEGDKNTRKAVIVKTPGEPMNHDYFATCNQATLGQKVLQGKSQVVQDELSRLGEKFIHSSEGTRALARKLYRELDDKFLQHGLNSGNGRRRHAI
ncbi:uncharacterized protein LOC121757638 [Salvia splendens]|uniref:uncharacterized protein LOC121757638 n=1 Tax=Salvia splendens TaxID=180675 RepID=UPI001C275DB0|nr:uncharacterized protein LOC121757638 [Salvia splendens]